MPKLKLRGPEPDAPKLVAQLARKRVYFAPPRDNKLTLSLERDTALLRAEAALAGDNEDGAPLRVLAGGEAIVSRLDGRCHVTSRDGGREILFVCCPKSGESQGPRSRTRRDARRHARRVGSRARAGERSSER